MSRSLWSQLCSGSLGDPVVHITFGAGAAPGPLKPGVTTYSHVYTNCPGDGFYTVPASTSNCFSGSWHSIVEDHTPNDANGYFMLVNASFTPGDFFVDTVRGLCNNTTYEFAAWVMNVLRQGFCGGGIDPDLTFTIETTTGTVLARHNSGNISESGSPTWSQYGVFFTTPVNITDVVVRITNNAPGGCGNDLALDDITFRPCGPVVKALISSSGKDSAMLCEGDASSLTLTSSYPGGFASPAFQWQESSDNGVTWKNITGAINVNYLRPPTMLPGSYQYKMLIGEAATFNSATCRTASNIITVSVNPLPVLSFTEVMTGCENTNLQVQVSGGATYRWSGPNGFTSSSPSLAFSPLTMSDAGRYTVLAISDKGCPKSGFTDLTVFPSVNAAINQDVQICEGTSTTLAASGGLQYQWSPAKGLSNATVPNPEASPTDTTDYTVVVRNQHGCSDTAQVTVNVWKKPVANAGPDKRARAGTPIRIDGSVKGSDISYYWTPSGLINSGSLTPTANAAQSTTYTLHVVSGVGCGSSTDNMELRVYEIPNAFSPNGDGINDNWVFKSPDAFAGGVVEIFNRFGQIIYHSKGYSKPWDGTYNSRHVPAGTYYYVIDLKSNNEPAITGWVLVVR